MVKYYLFEKELLCYYKEDFYNEKEDKDDILLYSIELYIENNEIIEHRIEGSFAKDINLFLEEVINKSKQKLLYKQVLIKER